MRRVARGGAALLLVFALAAEAGAEETAYVANVMSLNADARPSANRPPQIEWLALRVHPREVRPAGGTPSSVSSLGAGRPGGLVLGGPATAGTDAVALVRAFDPDGDALVYRYTWWVNGVRRAHIGARLETFPLHPGDTVQVRVVASDGLSESAPFESPVVPVENRAPWFTSMPPTPSADGVFRYVPRVEDPDGETRLAIRLVRGPAGMTWTESTSEVTWAPAAHQRGRHRIELEVEDAIGARGTQGFDLVID